MDSDCHVAVSYEEGTDCCRIGLEASSASEVNVENLQPLYCPCFRTMDLEVLVLLLLVEDNYLVVAAKLLVLLVAAFRAYLAGFLDALVI